VANAQRGYAPVRFGGTARHTAIEIDFAAVHVFTMCEGRATRLDMYATLDEALEAAGIAE